MIQQNDSDLGVIAGINEQYERPIGIAQTEETPHGVQQLLSLGSDTRAVFKRILFKTQVHEGE